MLNPRQLTSLLQQILILFVSLIALDFVLPALGAAYSHVFFSDEIKLPARAKSAIAKEQAYTQESQKYKELRDAAESAINAALHSHDYANLQALNTLRQQFKLYVDGQKDPILKSAFFENSSLYYLLTAHFALAVVIILAGAQSSWKPAFPPILTLALLLYIVLMSTNWLRNFRFYDTGRTVFSFVNWDLSPLCFFIQEFQILVLCILITYCWFYLFNDFEQSVREIEGWRIADPSVQGVDESIALAGRAANYLNKLISRSQINSILIVCAFLPWTLFY